MVVGGGGGGNVLEYYDTCQKGNIYISITDGTTHMLCILKRFPIENIIKTYTSLLRSLASHQAIIDHLPVWAYGIL